MRKIYLLINLILLAGVVGLLAAHQNFKPTPADKILKWKPAEVSIQEASPKPQRKAPQLSVIRNKNIFSPARGEDRSAASAEENKKTSPPRFELIGICTIGDGTGAIIDLKNVSGGDKGNKVRRYYALGAEVYSGFLLDSVAEKSVILKRKNETLELKIDRSRYAAEVGKNETQPPAQTVPPPVQPPRMSSPPAGSPVTRGPGMPPPGVNL